MTTLSRARLRALAAALALVLVVAACGSDGDSDAAVVDDDPTTEADDDPTTIEDDANTTEADPTTTTEDAGDPAEAEALAEAVVLDEDDFTDEWTAEEPTDDADEFGDCVSDVDLDAELEAEVDSLEFSQSAPPVQIGVSSTGLVFPDEETATALVDEVGSKRFAGCVLDGLVASFEEDGATVADADLNPAPGALTVGDQTSTLNGSFSLEIDDGTTVDGELSLSVIRTGAVVTGFSVFDLGDTRFAEVVDEVAGVIGDKHEAELG